MLSLIHFCPLLTVGWMAVYFWVFNVRYNCCKNVVVVFHYLLIFLNNKTHCCNLLR